MKSLKSAARRKRTGPRTVNSVAASSTSNSRRDFELVDSEGIRPRLPRPARRNRVIELHRNDEGDAPVRVDDTEERAEAIQRLCNHNATADRRRHFRRDVVLHQSQSRSASPTQVQSKT